MADKGKEPRLYNPQEQMLQRSKDKGQAPANEIETINLMDLKSTNLDKALEVKVYRKWTSKNVPEPNPTGLCFMLLGRDGSAIQANVQLWDMRQFDSGLQVGSCYRIESGGCKKTENWQRTLNNPLTLLFGRYTEVVPIQDKGFPEHYFNFVAYNEVGQRADAKDHTLTDYIGAIRNIGHIRELQTSIVTEIGSSSITPLPTPHSDGPAERVRTASDLQSTTICKELFQGPKENSPPRAPKKPKVD